MDNKKIVYHGTAWEKPFILESPYYEQAAIFNGLNTKQNELGAFYVSNSDAICEFFSGEKHGSDLELFLPVVLKIELADNESVKREFELGKKVEYNGRYYDYSKNEDRLSLYDELRISGVQTFRMVGDYHTHENGEMDDIAVFDDSIIKAVSAKLFIDNEWTDYLPYEKCIKNFISWSNSHPNDSNVIEYEKNNKVEFFSHDFGYTENFEVIEANNYGIREDHYDYLDEENLFFD